MNIDVLIDKDKYTIEGCCRNIIEYLNQYNPYDALKLVNYCIMKLNSDSMNSSGYGVSPKLMFNLLFIYSLYAKIGYKEIVDIDNEYEEFISLVDNLTLCYNYKILTLNEGFDENGFHKSFLSYHLDYPTISIRQFIEFFYSFSKVIEKEYSPSEISADDIIKGIFLLMNIERALNKDIRIKLNIVFKKKLNKKCKISIKKGRYKFRIFISIPVHTAELILQKYKIDSKRFMEYLFTPVLFDNDSELDYFTNIYNKYKRYIGIRHNDVLCMPRNKNVMHRLFALVLDSEHSTSLKDSYLEDKTYNLLIKYFGVKNVYRKLYDEEGYEQDIIVVYNDYVISFECKSTKFKEPMFSKEIAEKRLRQNFDRTVQKAFNQAQRIAERVVVGYTKYYDSDKIDKRCCILDLSNTKLEKLKSVIVTLDEYHNLATELHKRLISKKLIDLPWVINIFSLEIILNKCELSYDIDFFLEFLENRSNTYGSVISTNNDELAYFGYYIKYGNLLKDTNNIGIQVDLGNGYTTFVTDYLLIDDYLVFTEYLGI